MLFFPYMKQKTMIAASSVETEAFAKTPLVKCFQGVLSNMLLVVRLSFQKG